MKKETVFWVEKPKVLLNKKLITEIMFNNKMSLEEKLNALTRFIVIITIVGYVLIKENSIILLGATFVLLVILYYYYLRDNKKFKEALSLFNKNNKKEILNLNNPLDNPLTNDFCTENKKNEALNNELYKDEINDITKKSIINMNKDNSDNDKLFNDLETNYNFENSMRQFHSVAGSSVPNNQDNFLKYCYGKLPSDKNINVY
tara:strand:- start:550 stop:1158 length:609 start_codon:yes stop_codon:yes gene_type:complete